ncbi:MAG TPA: alpha-ketoacid dehydrogenase subunit beta [Candidatus Methylomirabilis sp.]
MAEREITYREAVNEALRQEMRRDPSVILLGEDIAGGAGTHHPDAWGGVLAVTKGLIGEFGPARVLDTPITESGYIGAAVGAAATGLRPVAELMFVDFLGVTFDQIFNQAAKLHYMFGGKAKVPLVIRTTIGAGISSAGQHSQVLYSIFAHVPGLKVVAPSTPRDMKGLLAAAIRDDDPVIVCENKVLYNTKGPVPEEPYVTPLGVADVVRAGRDVTIVAISRMVHVALEAAAALAREEIEAEVLDPRTLSPLDEEAILASVRKTKRLVVVDEDTPICSVARDIAARAADRAFEHLDAPIRCVTAPHTPVPFSPVLERFYVPSAGAVVDAVRSIMGAARAVVGW